MADDRHLDWEGCHNVRDLGGLPVGDGPAIRRGALVRADDLARLTAAGWAALWGHGIRTILDLRNDAERAGDVAARPAGLRTLRLPLDLRADAAFMRAHGLCWPITPSVTESWHSPKGTARNSSRPG